MYTTEKTISRHLKIIKIIRIILYSGVHNRKTISWHLIPIISFVSSFYSSQRGKLFKAHLSDLRCYRWNVSSTKKLFRVFLNSLIEMNRFFNLSFIHATLHWTGILCVLSLSTFLCWCSRIRMIFYFSLYSIAFTSKKLLCDKWNINHKTYNLLKNYNKTKLTIGHHWFTARQIWRKFLRNFCDLCFWLRVGREERLQRCVAFRGLGHVQS